MLLHCTPLGCILLMYRIHENKRLENFVLPYTLQLNEELNDLYSSPNIVRVIKSRMSLAGHVARMGEWRLVGKPEGKRPLGRPRRRWEYNIKMYLQEVECEGIDWIELAQDRDR